MRGTRRGEMHDMALIMEAHLRADVALVEAYLGGPRPAPTPAVVFAARGEPAS